MLCLLVPPACAACSRGLGDVEAVLCPDCRRGLPWLADLRCGRCGLPAPCRLCPAAAASWDAAWAPLAYAGSARDVVAALKFSGRLPLADAMAAAIAANAPTELLAETVLVPVPLHPARRRTRGFNQAERLAQALSARSGLPVCCCLRRRGPPTRQVGAGRRARLSSGRVRVAARGRAPERATLVDDVHTTGATLDACARALREAGATTVNCLTFARALP